ncbi:MAG: ABC transporter ATP-binding protein/permease [Erysipelotrichaceae bacterium]|nr:ABC transporter ATP-binding protein/permease [Erysipelotrichaceae bacterium]
MIFLNKVNKFYNKNKSNEIHVINDVTLTLPDSGLVSFVGKSGCGKTTLLNVIGGLDKSDNGSIFYDDEKKIINDTYRKEHIGYIFQNYLLIDNMSIYDNLKTALEINGILDNKEQEKRISYVLNAVNLYKYRKKMVNKLSGGQQQRVSIARALLKECKVIIADEPTGNLDSENTIEVMNILKKLSEKTLVLLVTHNEEIASFYSDRIIKIKDGCIIEDTKNTNDSSMLNLKVDNTIYLKDFAKNDIKDENLSMSLYSKKLESENIQLTLVYQNDTIYLKANKKVQLIDQSNIKLVDEHYKKMDQEEVNNFSFDISWYEKPHKNFSFKLFLKDIKKAFFSFIHARKKAKVFHIIFAFVGIAMALCSISYQSYSTIDDTNFSSENVTYLFDDELDSYENMQPHASVSSLNNLIDEEVITDIYYCDGYYLSLNYQYNSIRKKNVDLRFFAYPYCLSSSSLLCGKEPFENQVVIGKSLADYLLSSLNIKNGNYDSLINAKINHFYKNQTYDICGVSKNETNSVYFDDVFYQISFNSTINDEKNNYEIANENYSICYKYYEDYQICEGRDIASSNEIIVNDIFKNLVSLNDSFEQHVIVGFFKSNDCAIITLDKSFLGYQVSYDFTNTYLQDTLINIQSIDKFSFKLDNYRDENSRLPKNEKEILVNVNSKYQINEVIDDYTVVGYYYSKNLSVLEVLTTNKGHLKALIAKDNYYDLVSYQINEDKIDQLSNYKIKSNSPYEYDRIRVLIENKQSRTVYIVFTIILLIFVIVYIYFSMKSKIILQIKTIGVYRSIGASKRQIYRQFLADILIEATFTSVFGYIITIFFNGLINLFINSLLSNSSFSFPIVSYLFAIIFLYLVFIVLGILPCVLLLRKTPAQINAKYDI